MSSLERTRILLVDDEPELAENVAELLELEGARVHTASTATQALAAVDRGFDVVVLDVRLPDGRGVDLVPRLKTAHDSPLEVVLITGNASLEDAIAAVETDAYAYVVKPFDPRNLVTTVARAALQVRLAREAQQLSDALERREANLRALVETVQALLVELDDRGFVLQANSAAVRAVRSDFDDVVGSHWIDRFVLDEDQGAARTAFARCLEKGRADHEHRIVPRDGSPPGDLRVVQWAWTSVTDETGTRRVFASGLDVTELRAAQRKAALSEKLAAIGTMAAGLAHEIRNPLNAAHLQLELLERRAAKSGPSEAMTGIVRTIQGEIGRLSRLVDDFLLFARPAPLRAAPVDLGDLAEHVADLERAACNAEGVTLVVRRPEHAVTVEADRERISQVLWNLVRNAREAVAPSGGTVTVEVRERADGAEIVVRDDGPGIPEAILSRIFEPFFSTKEGGTGLGMAICHSAVALHGGDLQAANDGGAVFRVRLPAHPPTQEAHAPGTS